VVPLYQSVLSGLLIGLKGEIGGSLRVYLKNQTDDRRCYSNSVAQNKLMHTKCMHHYLIQ